MSSTPSPLKSPNARAPLFPPISNETPSGPPEHTSMCGANVPSPCPRRIMISLVVTTGEIMILRGHGDGTFAPHIDVCSGGPLGVSFDIGGNNGALAFGDFNGDGVLDMIDYSSGFDPPGPASLVLSGFSTNPVISQAGLVNAATTVSGPVSPGGLVTVYGENLGVAACGGVGEEILFNGIPAGIQI